jgi:hypothetical protein
MARGSLRWVRTREIGAHTCRSCMSEGVRASNILARTALGPRPFSAARAALHAGLTRPIIA